MTNKKKLEPAKQPKKKTGRVVDDGTPLDYESFNWLHSGRTPEEKKRDAEIQEKIKEWLRESGYGDLYPKMVDGRTPRPT